MVDLENVKKRYVEKEKLDEELIKQLNLIKGILGPCFSYKEFDNFVNYQEITCIYDILDVEDGILDIFFLNEKMDLGIVSLDKELLTMTEKRVKTNKGECIMTLIEQAIQAEQEYKTRMKEATDRLKHIQGYLGHIYIAEEIIGVESVSIKDDMVHLDVRCSFEAYGLDDDGVFSCDIPLVIFNATDNQLIDYRNISLSLNALEKLQDSREEYQRNLSIIRRSQMEIECAEKANKKLEEKYGALVK